MRKIEFLVMLMFFFTSCERDNDFDKYFEGRVKTRPVTEINEISAVLHGQVIIKSNKDAETKIIESGFTLRYNTQTRFFKCPDRFTGNHSFSISISDLIPYTSYNVQAYVIVEHYYGTNIFYGNTISFTTK